MKILKIFIVLLIFYPNFAQANIISGNTFISQNKLDRFYFEENGKFTQQIEVDWKNITAGNFITGLWSIDDNNKLCLDYLISDQDRFCLEIIENLYSGQMILKTDNDKNVFIWSKKIKGNWLLNPENLLSLKEKIYNITSEVSLISESDPTIVDYIKDKVFYGYKDDIYLINSDFTGFIFNKKTSTKLPLKWSVKNEIITLNIGGIEQKIVIKFGDEFFEKKQKALIMYVPNYVFLIEGIDIFLAKLDEYKEKDIFK